MLKKLIYALKYNTDNKTVCQVAMDVGTKYYFDKFFSEMNFQELASIFEENSWTYYGSLSSPTCPELKEMVLKLGKSAIHNFDSKNNLNERFTYSSSGRFSVGIRADGKVGIYLLHPSSSSNDEKDKYIACWGYVDKSHYEYAPDKIACNFAKDLRGYE